MDGTHNLGGEPAPPRSAPLGGGGLRVLAPAKINLNLLVGPRGTDGYHPIDSLAAKVSLYDRLELRRRTDGRVTLLCRGADCGPEEDNLAIRAGRLLAERAGARAAGVDIELLKAIPPGSGLGGGSSDAAAVLWGLDRLWSLGLDAAALLELAASLGSDVPLFLGPRACRVTGRGQHVQPLDVHPFWAVLLLPPWPCGTPDVYRRFDRLPVPERGEIDPGVLAQPPAAWRGLLRNDLAAAACAVCPELGSLWRRASAAAGAPVHMTGSGSGLFILCDGPDEAAGLLERLPADLPCGRLVVRSNRW